MTATATPQLVTTIDGSTVELEEDWGLQAQRAAEAHLEECWRYAHAEQDGVELEGESPSVGPFCGGTCCAHTCEVRETIFAVLPFIEAGVLRDGPQSAT